MEGKREKGEEVMNGKGTAKVSVIVPVYNAERYLKQCVESILAQTLKNVEIIFVDDGSTDGSLEILKDYQAKDYRIRVISQENTGGGAARNRGMKEASGEYLCFLDADDYFEPAMLERMSSKMDATSVLQKYAAGMRIWDSIPTSTLPCGRNICLKRTFFPGKT